MKIRDRSTSLLLTSLLCLCGLLRAQSSPQRLQPILEEPVLPPEVVRYQLDQYLMRRVPQLPNTRDVNRWTGEVNRIRDYLLNQVIFHGWPEEWVTSSPVFEEVGTVPSGPGYQVHKLRYEIVPGFYSAALLYVPEKMEGLMDMLPELWLALRAELLAFADYLDVLNCSLQSAR